MKHFQRAACVYLIAGARVRLVTILVHKPSLSDSENFSKSHRLYFYATRFLVERISWFCRDNQLKDDAGDGGCELIFDERKGMRYANMEAYFRLLRRQRKYRPCAIEWSVISPDRIVTSSGLRRVGLQIADSVSGSFFCAVDAAKGKGVCDYAERLRPVVYRRSGCRGYGVKDFPTPCKDQVATAFLEKW